MTDKQETDFLVTTYGSVWTFQPLTDIAKDFTKNNLDVQDWQWMGRAFGVDYRIANDLLIALEDEGFVMEIR